ncbi:MAG TPA: hypothetical protein VGG20_14495 [Thermoanaerobaculia bacterium]
MRSNAGILPSFLLGGADEIEALIAEMKELKGLQRVYAAELKATIEAKRIAMARGIETARYMRTAIKYIYGRKNARISQFGIRLRRRPQRKAGPDLQAVPAPAETAPTAAWETQTARAERPPIGAEGGAERAKVERIGGAGAPFGGDGPPIRGTASDDGAVGSPERAAGATLGAEAPDNRGIGRAVRGELQTDRGEAAEDRLATTVH